MTIALIGLNHKTAPLSLREKVHLPEERLPAALETLRQKAEEGLIFSTCNRFEILLNRSHIEETRDLLVSLISEYSGLPPAEFESALYHYTGQQAVHHVFRVASSLDSMVIGEPQILGQMKQFFAIAREKQTVGSTLNAVMERAFAVAKKVRTETMIAQNAVSVSSVAVELACKIFGRLDGKTALIIGAGKMSTLAIRHLLSRGIRTLLVTNRTFQKAAQLAEEIKGRAVPFESMLDCLLETDIVISSTGSQNYLIKKDDVHSAMGRRRNRPIFFIDIAVPRDIDPRVNEIDNTFVYDLDDLKKVAETNRKEREKEAEKAESLVAKEAEIFWNRLKSIDIAPTIREIQSRIEMLRQRELEKTLKRLGPLNQEQKEALEQLTTSLTNKLVQNSFVELKTLVHQPDGLEKIELIKKLFKL